MNNNGFPEHYVKNMLHPMKLSNQQEELRRRLESLNQRTSKGIDLPNMFIGAIYATREECRSNPDWIAQSANSFREILYHFYAGKKKVKDSFRDFGSATTEENTFQQSLGTVFGKMTEVAHHKPISNESYEILIEEFQKVLLWALDRQVDIHTQIDKFLSRNGPGESGK